MKNYVKNGMKALVAAAITVLSSLGAVLVGDAGIGSVTDGQWVTIIGAGLASLGAVYGIRNIPPPSQPADGAAVAPAPSASPAPAGGRAGG